MHWTSFFSGIRRQGWTPVNDTDQNDPGMDELMQMAVEGDYDDGEEHTGNHPRSSARASHSDWRDRASSSSAINSSVGENFNDDIITEPVFHHRLSSGPTQQSQHNENNTNTMSESLSASALPCLSSRQSHDSSTSCGNFNNHNSALDDSDGHTNLNTSSHHRYSDNLQCNGGKKSQMVFPKRKCHLILLSIFIPVLFIAVSTGLGVYSLLVYKTDKLVIDKSVKSFSIPNHKVYKNFEAMMLARKDNSSMGRHKREAPDYRDIVDRNSNKQYSSSISREKRAASLSKEAMMMQDTKDTLSKLNSQGTGFRKESVNNIKFSQSISKSSSALKEDKDPSLKSKNDGGVIQRVKRVTREIGCLFKYQSVVKWKMHVIYLAKGPGEPNMFTKERLETVHEIERKIIQHPQFDNFCLRDPNMEKYDPAVREMNGCIPVNSLLTYFYPSKDSRGHIFYDGMGSNIDDISSALALAMNHETFYYYVDDKINTTYKKSHLLRSEVLFGAPLPGFTCVGDDRQKDVFKDFVITYIDLLSKVSTDKVSVLYGGNEIFDYEVSTSFWSDIRLALVSLVAIFLLLLILSLSVYLTIVGIVLIALSFPISLFFYRVVFGINALGILNGAAAFVIIGIGVDDVFVFINIYRQSSHMRDPVSRVKYTIKTAGVATFFTSFTTAAAFAANLFSSIPAVYEFGLFMSLIVSSCWISVFVLMPPLLYLHACCVEPLEKYLFSCFSCVGIHASPTGSEGTQGQGRDVHPADTMLLEGDGELLTLYEDTDDDDDDDDDEVLLDVNGDSGSRDSSSSDNRDVPMLDVTNHPTNSASRTQREPRGSSGESVGGRFNSSLVNKDMSNNNMCLGRIIQRCLMFLTHRIVIPGRFVVIGFYVVVLCTSCLLMTRLQPSTHPPQLFRPDTNLQRLLDLKANFSIIDALHCDRCSGLYKVKPSPTHMSSHEKPLPSPPLPPVPSDGIPAPPSSLPSSSSSSSPLSSNNMTKSDEGKATALINAAKTIAKGLLHFLHPSDPHGQTPKPSTQHDAGKNKEKVTTDGRSNEEEESRIVAEKRSYEKSDETSSKKDGKQVPFQDLFPLSPKSLNENFNVCKEQSCNNLKDRPLMESGATVYVVFGIKGLQRPQDDLGHVMDSFKGSAVFDSKFAKAFDFNFLFKGPTPSRSPEGLSSSINMERIRELCRVCHYLSNQTDLVKEGSAQCLPSHFYQLNELLLELEECRDLPNSLSIYHHQAPAHAEGGMDSSNRLIWLAFAFESTTQQGQAYFQAYKQYQRWEALVDHIKSHLIEPHSPLQTVFQTSEFWTKVMMEVVAVNSAIYGLVLSMLICIVAVAVFTGHIVLLLIVTVTILVMICCVVGIFYLAGWEMGAVEAVSLSILVGSSVDYCVHLVEGYILAGRRMDPVLMKSMPKATLRRQRTSLSVRHIGVAIVCSSLTTIVAAVPLTQTFIQPFTKFGLILLINTSVSMVVTLTLATALLATFAPARYHAKWRAHFLALFLVSAVVGLIVLGLYLAHLMGVDIPGPSGSNLFSS